MPTFIDDYSYDISKIWIGKLRKTKNPRYTRSDVYLELTKYTKLRIKTPFLLSPFKPTIFNAKNVKMCNITAVLNPLTSKRKEFMGMIKKIDQLIFERMGLSLDDEYTFIDSIIFNNRERYKHKIMFRLPQNKDGTNNFLLYDKNKTELDIDDITPNAKIICIIELHEIWADHTEKTCSITWNVVHCKLFPELTFDKNYVDDDLEDESEITLNKNLGSSKENYKVKCPNCNHKLELTININIQGIIENSGFQNHAAPHLGIPNMGVANIPMAPMIPMAPVAPSIGMMSEINNQPKYKKSADATKKEPVKETPGGFMPNLDDIQDKLKKLKSVKTKKS